MLAFKAAAAMVAALPAAQAFKATEAEHVLTPQELSLIDSVGTTPCIFKLGDAFYDYTPLKIAYPNPEAPYFDGNVFPRTITPQYQFVWGWCQQLDDIADQTLCQENYYVGRLDAVPEPTASSTCTQYSGGDALKDIQTEEITGKPNTKDRLEKGDTSELSGVRLTYNNGPICQATGEPTQFSLNMYCNPDVAEDYFDYSLGVLGDICSPYLDTVSWVACARLDVSELWEYIGQYSEYFGIFFLIAGTLLVLIGRKLLKPAICFAGFLTTLAVSCLIFYSVYLKDESDLADFWYFLGGGALAGIFVGLLACWLSRIGAAVLAGWGGLCGGLILNETLLFRAEMEWLFWTSIVLCTLSAAILAFFIMDEVVIVSTVLLGSYSLVRGVSAYAGHYYNEVTMAKMAKEGLLDDIDPWYWAYVAGFFVMLVVGMLVQCKSLKKERAEKEAKKHPYRAISPRN